MYVCVCVCMCVCVSDLSKPGHAWQCHLELPPDVEVEAKVSGPAD